MKSFAQIIRPSLLGILKLVIELIGRCYDSIATKKCIITPFFACMLEELRADREAVLEAVKCDGLALEYASKDLKADREAVLEAVKNEGYALSFASKALQTDITLFDEAYGSKSASGNLAWRPYPNLNRLFMHQRLCHVYKLFEGNAWFKDWLSTLFGKHLDDASFLVIEQLSFKDAVQSRAVCKAGLKELLLHRGAGQSSSYAICSKATKRFF